jgi:hypothetical protein
MEGHRWQFTMERCRLQSHARLHVGLYQRRSPIRPTILHSPFSIHQSIDSVMCVQQVTRHTYIHARWRQHELTEFVTTVAARPLELEMGMTKEVERLRVNSSRGFVRTHIHKG